MKVLSLLGAGVAVAAAPLSHLADNARSNLGKHRILSIPSEGLTEATVQVLHQHGADHFGNQHFKLSPEAVLALEESNISFQDATEEWIKHFEESFRDENFFCNEADCADRSLEDFYSTYHNLDSLVKRAQSKIEGVSFAKMTSIGKSYEGRDQVTVEIGDSNKPLVFYWCNIHAREWLTPHYCTYMIETLVADGGHPLLDTFSFTVVISANPDGYAFSISDNNMWRKTRRPNTDVGNDRCVGTDPNRNYDFYHCGAGTSNNPCSDVYCGPRPFSEIEVANIRDYAAKYADRIIATNDVHAYGGMWMTPYGAISEDPPEPDYSHQMECSLAAVEAVQQVSGGKLWKYGPTYSTIYPAAGSSVDYLYAELGVTYAMTAEVRGSSFQPHPSNIMPSNIEVFAALQASLACIAGNEGFALSELPPLPTLPRTGDQAPCDFFFC